MREEQNSWVPLSGSIPAEDPASMFGGAGAPSFSEGSQSGPGTPQPASFALPPLLQDAQPLPAGPSFRRVCSRVGLAFSLMMMLFYFGQIALLALFGEVLPLFAQSAAGMWVCTDLALYGFGAPVCWLLLRGMRRKLPAPVRPARFARMTLPWAGRLFCLGELFAMAGGLASRGIKAVLHFWLGGESQNAVAEVLAGTELWVIFLFCVLVAAVGEELLFRELLYHVLAPFGERSYLLLSAALFSLFHGNLDQIPYAFLMGLLLAWLRCRTGRVYWGMLLHGVLNFCGGFLPFLVADSLTLTALWGWAILIFCAVGGVYLFRMRIPRRLRGTPRPAACPLPGHPVRAALLNPGMLLALLLSAVLVAITIHAETGVTM